MNILYLLYDDEFCSCPSQYCTVFLRRLYPKEFWKGSACIKVVVLGIKQIITKYERTSLLDTCTCMVLVQYSVMYAKNLQIYKDLLCLTIETIKKLLLTILIVGKIVVECIHLAFFLIHFSFHHTLLKNCMVYTLCILKKYLITTLISFIFVIKIFLYAKNARKFCAKIYIYIKNFSNEYLQQVRTSTPSVKVLILQW